MPSRLEHPDWTNQFETGLPDCLTLGVENFSKYLIDIQLWSSKVCDYIYKRIISNSHFSNRIQNMHDRIQYIQDHLFVSVIIQFKQKISVTIFCVVVIMFKMSSMKSAHFRTGKL